MRSSWKIPFIAENLLRLEKEKIPYNRKIWNRSSIVLPKFLNKTVKIHNGRNFLSVLVIPYMIGKKFGQFVFTRVARRRRSKQSKR